MSLSATPASLDLAAFNATGESVMTVKNPNDGSTLDYEGKPITITLHGIDSDQFRKAALFQRNRQKKDLVRGRMDALAESEDAGLVESLAAATKVWSAMPVAGRNLEFSPSNCRQVYRDLPWLREAVADFIGIRSNFTKASPTT